jgi:hypothetical protein
MRGARFGKVAPLTPALSPPGGEREKEAAACYASTRVSQRFVSFSSTVFWRRRARRF